jgi:hypothetical protein
VCLSLAVPLACHSQKSRPVQADTHGQRHSGRKLHRLHLCLFVTLLDLAFDLLLASLPAGAAAAGRPRCQGQAQLKAGTSSTRRIGEL